MATGDTFNTESPMSKTLYRSREQAYQAQAGKCYYCRCAMWLRSRDELTKRYGITARQARNLQCTAEHLVARSEGGNDLPQNIVAACRHCNLTRHKLKNPPSSDDYLRKVRSRVEQGGWYPSWLARVLRETLDAPPDLPHARLATKTDSSQSVTNTTTSSET